MLPSQHHNFLLAIIAFEQPNKTLGYYLETFLANWLVRKIPLSFTATFLPSSAPDLWREGTRWVRIQPLQQICVFKTNTGEAGGVPLALVSCKFLGVLRRGCTGTVVKQQWGLGGVGPCQLALAGRPAWCEPEAELIGSFHFVIQQNTAVEPGKKKHASASRDHFQGHKNDAASSRRAPQVVTSPPRLGTEAKKGQQTCVHVSFGFVFVVYFF